MPFIITRLTAGQCAGAAIEAADQRGHTESNENGNVRHARCTTTVGGQQGGCKCKNKSCAQLKLTHSSPNILKAVMLRIIIIVPANFDCMSSIEFSLSCLDSFQLFNVIFVSGSD